MATIKLSATKACSRAINYAEKKAEIKSGINCDVAYAKSQMKATRCLFGKDDKIQAHTVIQSFSPGEVTADQANQIGKELVGKLAPGHECTIYTHTDKDHIHNHIVINAVNFETGKKYQAHGKEAIERARSVSDDICREMGLSIIKSPEKASKRYTGAEVQMMMRGELPFKEKIRIAIDYVRKSKPTTFTELKASLKAFHIDMRITKKNIAFKTSEQERYIRGSKLGSDYTKGELENELERNERELTRPVPSRTFNEQAYDDKGGSRSASGTSRIDGVIDREPETKRTDEILHSSTNGQRNNQSISRKSGITSNQTDKQPNSRKDEFDFEEARTIAKQRSRNLEQGFADFRTTSDKEQSRSDKPVANERQGQSRETDRNLGRNQAKSREIQRGYEREL